MGVRGELFSTRIACDGRTYFFNVKENRMGDLFLDIVESKPTETGDFDRRSIVIFQDNADEFIKAFQKSLEAMAKAAPSERTKPPRTKREAMAPRDDGRETDGRLPDDERPRHFIDTGKPRRESAPSRAGTPDRRGDRHDGERHSSVRRDVDKATGRSSRDDAPRTTSKGRVLRVKSKQKIQAATPAPPTRTKPAAKRLTVRKVPKRDE